MCLDLGHSSLSSPALSLADVCSNVFAEPHMGLCSLALFFLGATLAGSPPNHTCSNYGSKGDKVMLVGVSLKPPTGTLFNLGESLKGKGHLLRLANESAKAQRG